jgi:hypothetical protein
MPKVAGYVISIGHEDHLLRRRVVTFCHIIKALAELSNNYAMLLLMARRRASRG